MTDENGFEEINGKGELEGYSFNIKGHPAFIPDEPPKIIQIRCGNCMCENKDNPTEEIEKCWFFVRMWDRGNIVKDADL